MPKRILICYLLCAVLPILAGGTPVELVREGRAVATIVTGEDDGLSMTHSLARSNITSVVAMRVQWQGSDVGWVRGAHTYDVDLDAINRWERLRIVAIAPEGVDKANVFLHVNNMSGGEEVLFDNLSVRRILREQ